MKTQIKSQNGGIYYDIALKFWQAPLHKGTNEIPEWLDNSKWKSHSFERFL